MNHLLPEQANLSASNGFSALDIRLGEWTARLAKTSRNKSLLVATVALLSRAVREGHVCLYLNELAEAPSDTFPPLESFKQALFDSGLAGSPETVRPLILDEANRLYFYRYFQYESALLNHLTSFCQEETVLDERCYDALDRLFGPDSRIHPNPQRQAADTALSGRFCVVSGGPGTGKTWIAVRILWILTKIMDRKVALAAPTGKAAARLEQSLRESLKTLPPELDPTLLPKACTLHRLLEPIPHSPYFRYNAENRLPVEDVIIDEASMIDLPLFAKLVSALPDTGRLILLGDRHQLASVETGAALNDICSAADRGGCYNRLTKRSVTLMLSRRFSQDSPLGKLAQLVNQGEGEAAISLMEDAGIWKPLSSSRQLNDRLTRTIEPWLSDYLTSAEPDSAFNRLDALKILCALNRSAYGIHAVNDVIGKLALSKQPTAQPGRQGGLYRGFPVMVLRNDYAAGLFNGDTGVAFPDAEGRMYFHFKADNGFHPMAPLKLPEHQTAYALTVHKSQGSEFGKVILILPPFDSEVITRELIYTALTRAKESVEVWGDKGVFIRAVGRKIERRSGLTDRLLQRLNQPV
ncbi:MAG: exodeoxyribonuclease V subunit alpha [Elusimicrobia bacterium RIFOXYB2_FULL_49_7]|nr:MAG: exodeoxyribonuclease V subunit alpha [Elusimicrobia bacterium RIFOXYB2_FULL_49_7]